MIHTIENDYLRVSVDDHGAELCSIFDKVHNREVIWQADPAYWKRHAPVPVSMGLPGTANLPAWI